MRCVSNILRLAGSPPYLSDGESSPEAFGWGRDHRRGSGTEDLRQHVGEIERQSGRDQGPGSHRAHEAAGPEGRPVPNHQGIHISPGIGPKPSGQVMIYHLVYDILAIKLRTQPCTILWFSNSLDSVSRIFYKKRIRTLYWIFTVLAKMYKQTVFNLRDFFP